MQEIKTLGQRAISSVITLTSRTFLLNIINFAGAFALTIFLSPADFGIFIITSTIIDILTYFSDIGLAGALIQKKEKPTDNEIHATFTIQMTLVTVAIAVAFLFREQFQNAYGLNNTAVWLFYALLIAFFFSSLKTIPSVLSERAIHFDKVVIPQIIETVIFNVLVVFLAWKGWGLRSYIVAVLARAVTGTIAIYVLVPYRPKIMYSLSSVKNLLGFGIPYQLNSFIAVLKDKVSLLILGRILGVQALGYLGWAEKWANLPLRYFLDASVKVSFSLFSRIQSENERLKKALENSICFISVLVFPMLAGLSVIIPMLVEIIPKYSKWAPALPVFQLFLISAGVASISTFLSNTLTALGKVKAVLGLMVMWTVLTLILYPLMAYEFGVVGVGIASVLVSLSSVVPYYLVRRHIKPSMLPVTVPALVGSLLMVVVLKWLREVAPLNWLGVGLLVAIGVVTYGGVLFILDSKRMIERGKLFINLAKK